MLNLENQIIELFNEYDPLECYDGDKDCYLKEVNNLLDDLKDIHLNNKELMKYFTKTYGSKFDKSNKEEFIDKLLDLLVYIS